MGKLKNKKELTEIAAEFFKKDEKLDSVFATGDGNVFLPESENAAKLHANGKGLKLYEILRETPADEADKKTVVERIAEVEKLEVIQDIQKVIDADASSRVKSAGQAKIKAIMDAESAAKSEAEAKAKADAIEAAKKTEAEKAKATDANKEVGTKNS